jgi:hypothetical protein
MVRGLPDDYILECNSSKKILKGMMHSKTKAAGFLLCQEGVDQMSFSIYWWYATNTYYIWGKKKCLRLTELFSLCHSLLFPVPNGTYTGLVLI